MRKITTLLLLVLLLIASCDQEQPPAQEGPTVTQIDEGCGADPLGPLVPLDRQRIDLATYTIPQEVVLVGDQDQIGSLAQQAANEVGIEIEVMEQSVPLPVAPANEGARLYRLFVRDRSVRETLALANGTIAELQLNVVASADAPIETQKGSSSISLSGAEREVQQLFDALRDVVDGVTVVRPFETAGSQPVLRSVDLSDASFSAEFIETFNRLALESAGAGGDSQIINAVPLAEPTFIGGDTGGSYIGVDGSGAPLPAADVTLFFEQNAFQHINLPREKTLTADGVRVLIFDSTPLPTGRYSIKLGPNEEAYRLCNHALISGDQDTLPTEGNSHGFFAAHLIHAVAPGTDLLLVQVLEFDKRLGLYTTLPRLIGAMAHYIDRLPDGEVAVVNLSLGLRQNEIPFTLKQALAAFEARGIVIAAAAGNQMAAHTQAPASHENVLGVAASIVAPGATVSEPSCYSNPGDISAPGGDDRDGNCAGDELGIVQTCETFWATQPDLACPFGILSLGMHAPDEPMFAYWLGTSFATPLVSGAAALALADGANTPAQVRSLVLGNVDGSTHAAFGAGELNIGRMFSSP